MKKERLTMVICGWIVGVLSLLFAALALLLSVNISAAALLVTAIAMICFAVCTKMEKFQSDKTFVIAWFFLFLLPFLIYILAVMNIFLGFLT
jgi:hypothetical protein